MAAKITILDQQFKPHTQSGLSVHTKNLAGCAGEIMRVQIDFAYQLYENVSISKLSISQQVNTGGLINVFTRLETSTDLVAAGFSAGDIIYGRVNISPRPYVKCGTAAVVAKNYMIITVEDGCYGFVYSDENLTETEIVAVNDITSIRFKPNIVNNNAKWNEKEYLTGEKIEFLSLGVGVRVADVRDSDWNEMEVIGSKNYQINEGDSIVGFDLNKPSVRYVGQYDYDGENLDQITWHQKFSITYSFIVPFYKLGQLNNILTGTAPKDFDKSKKFTFNLQLGKNQADCGSKKELIFSETSGSVGWFNSNFAGYPAAASLVSSGLNVGGDEQINISDLLAGKTITTRLKVGTGVLSTNWITLYFTKLNVNQQEINEKTTYQNDIIVLDCIKFKCNNSYYPAGGSTIFALTGNFFVKAKATLEYVPDYRLLITTDIKISDAHKNSISDGDKYLIWAVIQEDGTYEANPSQSNRTSVIISAGTLIEGEDIDGLADITDSLVIDESNQQTTDNKCWIEDNTKNVFNIALNNLTRNNVTYRTRVNSLTIAQVAHNETTNEFFYLSRYELPLVLKESSGTQLIEYNQDREDYILKQGNAFKQVVVSSDGADLVVTFGQKIDWQSWIALENGFADAFFDIAKPFDGGAHDASLYSDKNGFKIKNAVLARLEGINRKGEIGVSSYLFLSNPIECRTYSTDAVRTDIGGLHGTIAINSGTKLNVERPIVGKDSEILAKFISDDGGFVSIGNATWANIKIEEIGETAKEIHENSTTFDCNKAVYKDLRANLSIIGGEIVAKANLLKSYFDAAKSYKVTAKLEVANPVEIVRPFKYMVIKYLYDKETIFTTVADYDENVFYITKVDFSKYKDRITAGMVAKINDVIYTIDFVDNESNANYTLISATGYTPSLGHIFVFRLGGNDLDTATNLATSPFSVNRVPIGYGQMSNISYDNVEIFKFGGDNTQGGYESVLVDAFGYFGINGAGSSVEIDLPANWYGTRPINDYDNKVCDISIETYAGGNMSLVNYEFVNDSELPNNKISARSIIESFGQKTASQFASYTIAKTLQLTKLSTNNIIFSFK